MKENIKGEVAFAVHTEPRGGEQIVKYDADEEDGYSRWLYFRRFR
jgi:hypothetical protein